MRAGNIDSILLPHLVTFLELGTMLSGSQIPELTVDSLIFISTTPHALKGDRSFYEPPSHKSARTPLSRLPVKDVWAGTSLHAMGKGSSMPLADGTSSFLLLQANPENFASLGKATGVRLGENT